MNLYLSFQVPCVFYRVKMQRVLVNVAAFAGLRSKHRSIRAIPIERSLRISRTMLRVFVTTTLSPQTLLVVARTADDRVEIFDEKRKRKKKKKK